MHNTSNKIKLILIPLISLFLLSSNIQADDFYCNSDNIDDYLEAEIIEFIDIKTVKTRGWHKNFFNVYRKLASEEINDINERYKKKFLANINVQFNNKLECTFSSKIRISGDLKDHMGISTKFSVPFGIASLDVELLEGNINSVIKFKLFIPFTKGANNEVFSTALLTELGFLAPKTYNVLASFNGQKTVYLFQEKITKEFIESNKLREAPILEGDERFLFGNDLLHFDRFGLARIKNSKWTRKGYTSLNISKTALRGLNKAYLEYLHGTKMGGLENDRFLNPNAFFDEYSSDKVKGFPAILVAIGASHGLRPHNRSFYYDPIYNYLKPIYYDGNASVTEADSLLDEYMWFGLYLNQAEIIGASYALESFKNFNHKSFHLRLENLGLEYSEEEIRTIIEKVKTNLLAIKNYNEIDPSPQSTQALFYNNQIQHRKLPYSPYFSKLAKLALEESQKENFNPETDFNLPDHEKRRRLVFSTEKESSVEICDLSLITCSENLLSLKDYSKLLEGRYIDKNKNIHIYIGNKQEYVTGLNNKSNDIEKEFDIEFDSKLIVYGNSNVVIDYKEKVIELIQSNISDRFLIKESKLTGWSIKFAGFTEEKNINNQSFNKNLLTGCLTLLDLSVENISIEIDGAMCEDGVNMIRVVGDIDNIAVKNALHDAIDADFSKLSFNNIYIRDAGNDCVDLSAGDYFINYADVSDCNDKAFSVGEKSKLTLNSAKISNSNIGVAAKDSSIAEVNAINANSVNTCFNAYNKKQEFWGGKIKVKIHNCQTLQIIQEQNSLIEFL
jgi:hypothetical protein